MPNAPKTGYPRSGGHPKVRYRSPEKRCASACASCGTIGEGRASRGNHPIPAHFSGSTTRGSPTHDRAVKNQSTRSSIAAACWVRCW